MTLGSVYFLEWECGVWIPPTPVFTYLKKGGSESVNPWVPPKFGVGSGIPTPIGGGGSGNPLPPPSHFILIIKIKINK